MKFPIIEPSGYRYTQYRVDGPLCPATIPYGLIASHEEQAKKNHGQTIARLAERGGLAPSEAIAVLEDRSWQPMPEDWAIKEIMELVDNESIH